MQDHDREVHDQAGAGDRDQLDDLDRAGGPAEDVADFEVLEQLAGDRRRDTDHGRYA